MRVSYSNYPILEKLQTRWLTPDFICDEIQSGLSGQKLIDLCDTFNLSWYYNSIHFRKEINYISKPFQDATERSEDRIKDIALKMLNTGKFETEVSGTYIEAGGLTIMFRILYDKDIFQFTYELFCFHKNKLVAFHMKFEDKEVTKVSMDFNENDSGKDNQFCMVTLERVIFYYTFKKYAEVETKFIAPNSRIKTKEGKYINDTKLPITYLDSTWFTNLVKSDAFAVHGHFRLQHVGQDLQDLKLVWVRDYIKSGYTSHAKITKQSE